MTAQRSVAHRHRDIARTQRVVGRSSLSNPVNYVGVFDFIRRAFAAANRVSPALFRTSPTGSSRESSAGRRGGAAELDASCYERDVRRTRR